MVGKDPFEPAGGNTEKSVTHGQCDARPTVAFPTDDYHQHHRINTSVADYFTSYVDCSRILPPQHTTLGADCSETCLWYARSIDDAYNANVVAQEDRRRAVCQSDMLTLDCLDTGTRFCLIVVTLLGDEACLFAQRRTRHCNE